MDHRTFLELKTPYNYLYNIVPVNGCSYGLRGCNFDKAKEFCISFGIDSVNIFIY